MKKIIKLFIFGIVNLFLLMNMVFAKDIGNVSCSTNGSCILLCSYQNNFNGIKRNINIYYNYSKLWQISYDNNAKNSYGSTKGPSSFNKIFSSSGSPNVYFVSDKNEDNFRCPKYGYFDRNAVVEICFDDDGTTCEEKYSDKTWFSTRFGKWDSDFKEGSEKIDYDVFNDINKYYSSNNSILGDISCSEIINGQFNPNDNTQVNNDIVKDFKVNFLHNHDVPSFLKTYITSSQIKTYVVKAINNKKNECENETKNLYNSGAITEQEYTRQMNVIQNIDSENYAKNVADANANLPIEGLPSGDPSVVQRPTSVEPMDICSQNGVKQVLHIAGYITFAAKLIIPLLLIIMGTIDIVSALKDPEDKTMKDSISKFVKRIIAAVIIFFIPTIVNFGFSLIDTGTNFNTNFTECGECLFKPLGGGCNYTLMGDE